MFTFGAVFWFVLIFIGLSCAGRVGPGTGRGKIGPLPKETLTTTQQSAAVAWSPSACWPAISAWLYLAGILFPGFRQRLGTGRYIVTMVLLLLMIAVPAKIMLRLAFDIKYVLMTPWFNI